MSTRRKPTPSYLPHTQSGRARAVWTDPLGVRHQKLLPGPFDSPESRTAFARLQLEIEAAPNGPAIAGDGGVSVNELLLAFLEHAARHYRRADGSPTHEIDEYKLTARYVRQLYGGTAAVGFGPLALKALQRRFIAADWCRNFINQRIGRVRRMFKWAAGEELIPFAVYQALTAVTGLQVGRSDARESDPVGPVDGAVVDATLPHLNRHVRGLVEFQRLTGCRPGEACVVRRGDIDTTESVWLYKPSHHKLSYKKRARIIPIGPRAQALLREFFTPNPDDYLFCPSRAVDELRAARSAARKTPRYQSHMRRNAGKRKVKPARTPRAKYDRGSYGVAVDRACDRAFPPPGELAQRAGETQAGWWGRLSEAQRGEVTAWRKAHRWHPNQLRHTFGTAVRKAHGLEAAQVLLGHSRAEVTQVYAERNEALAAEIAAKIG